MGIKAWLQKKREQKHNAIVSGTPVIDEEVGKLWTKCYNCSANLPAKKLRKI